MFAKQFGLSNIRSKRVCGYILGMLMTSAATVAFAFEPLTYYGFDKDSHSAAAHEGLEEIYAGKLFQMAIPTATARMFLGALAASNKDREFAPNSPEAMFYSTGRLPSPPDRSSGEGTGFALGESVFDRDGASMVNINCLGCHSGVVNGQVVAGLANNHINQSDPRNARTRGDNYGPYEVWRLSSQLIDPANEGLALATEKTELQKLFNSVQLPPVDPMPWWLMKYKTKDYWYADAGPHDAASFSINFTTPYPGMNEHHEEHVGTVAKALTFARETTSPPFPESLDAELVQQGSDLFHGRVSPENKAGFRACKTCHGSYTKSPSEPDLSKPGSWTVDYDFSHVIRNVKTDPAYNETLKQFAPIAEHVSKLAEYYEAQGKPELAPRATVPSTDGYVAPPLVGVWASAPYFHNGSVPTIEAVLNSKQRPEIWSRTNRDPHAYNLEQVGMAYQDVTRDEFAASAAAAEGKPFSSSAAVEHSTMYDTAAYGHGNMGHTFGDSLTQDERLAVIEFLKSLSGPDMPPQ